MDSSPIVRIVSGLEQAIADQGIKLPKRKFSPHLTIGRFKFTSKQDIYSFIDEINNFEINTVFDTITLYNSKLASSGPIYTALYNMKLSK